MFAAEAHALVEFHAEPFERFDDVIFGSRHKAVRVGIFNAEHHFASMLTGKKVVIERGAHTADM